MPKILVIDDDPDMCLLLRRFLQRHHFEVADVTSGKKAMQWLETNKPQLILCDLRLEDMNGSEVLARVKAMMPEVPFIIITGYSDVKTAVDVMKLGAYDYVTKPLFPDEILVTIKQALNKTPTVNQQPQQNEITRNIEDKTVQKEGQSKQTSFQRGKYIFGTSIIFQQILRQIELVAPTNYSVIIYGESGSGKEAIASEIHNQSKRSKEPFVAIDCGALSRELAASELFGHEKGSFTGALNQKIGSFELANGGTIFLDEIANLSYEIQVSLLRVVQERKLRRVGGIKDIDLDVRIIVASNERLWDASRKGKFREDLFHRFNEFSINVPPLRERKEDIETFTAHFLQITNDELGKNVKGFSKEVMDIFKNYVWYGNLREMKNVVKRATLLTDGDYIEVISLPFEISNHYKLNPLSDSNEQYKDEENIEQSMEPGTNNSIPVQGKIKIPASLNLKSASIDAEFETIMEALKKVNFNKSKAAQLLNIDRKTLYNKMKEYQLINNQNEQ
ncbi:sigma-54 dependent transcriptional regulator [soil metagenome]